MKYVRFFRRTLPYLRPYWRLVVISAGMLILTTLVSLLSPWPLTILIDNVLGTHPLPPTLAFLFSAEKWNRPSLLIVAVLAGLAVTLLENGLSVVDNYVQTQLEQRMILDFRGDLFQHAQRLSLAFHDQRRSGQMINVINNQADAAVGLFMTIQPLAQSVLTLVGMVWILVRMDWQIALLSLSVMPFLYYSVGYYTSHVHTRVSNVKGIEGDTLSIIHEALSMIRVIVAFGREGYEYRRFRKLGEHAVDARVKLTVRQTLFSLAVNMITATGTALVLGVGAYRSLQGQLTAGELLVVMSYVAMVYNPLQTISQTLGSVQTRLVSLQMAFQLLDTEPEIQDKPNAVSLTQARGHIRFENVSFQYSKRIATLQNISFTVQAGQVVALVGPTGAGKTTLLSLLPRFYDPNGGQITLDGHDLRNLSLKSLRQQISLVLQEPLLFSGTIADNIRYGRLEASEDEIIAAAKAANAHDFIIKLPDQYQTQVGERGSRLSGGERQRISIARAFLKDAPILILDEPTSAIDSKTESVILDALDRLMAGRTTFMIAHRLSTIRHADVILVMNHGQLVEQGTHETLLQQSGLYKQLVDLQNRQRRPEAEPVPLGVNGAVVNGTAANSQVNGGALPHSQGHSPASVLPNDKLLQIAVQQLALTYRPVGSGYRVEAQICLQDTCGVPTLGASVTVNVCLPDGSVQTLTRPTDVKGGVMLSLFSELTGTYRFTIIQIVKFGYRYDITQNPNAGERVIEVAQPDRRPRYKLTE